MGAANSNCMRQKDVDTSVNGVQDTDVRPIEPPEEKMSKPKTEDKDDCPSVVPSSTTTDEDPGKRRHSTPSCGTAHLMRLGADAPGEDDVRWRRSGSAVPRRANRPTKDDCRRAALPAWAKAVRSSRADSSTSLQCRSSGVGTVAEGHDGDRSESTTDARRRDLQTNYTNDERRDGVDSVGSAGRSSGIRFESQLNSETNSPPLRDHIAPPTARPPQQRRSSIAFLPVSEGSTSLFSSKSAGAPLATKDRINLGFGNASDLVASLIGSRSHEPVTNASEDHFWVPQTIWKKTRAQSLVPQKMSTDSRVVPGKLRHMKFAHYAIHKLSIGYALAQAILLLVNKYRVVRKKTAQSLMRRHFATACSRITRFLPNCSEIH